MHGFIGALIAFFVFSPRLSWGAEFHLGGAATIILSVLYILRRGPKFFPTPLMLIVSILILFAIQNVVVGTAYGYQWHFFSRICATFSISLMVGWAVAYLVVESSGDSSRIMERIMGFTSCIVAANSILILLEFIFPSVRALVQGAFIMPSGLDYSSHPFRFRGFAAAGGAGLSVLHGLSVLFIYQLVRMKFFFRPGQGLVLAAIITLATFVVGRTGSIFAFFFLALLLVEVLKTSVNRRFFIGACVSLIVCAALIFNTFRSLDSEAAFYAYDWVFQSLKSGSLSTSSTDELFNSLSFPISFPFFFTGYGFFEGDFLNGIRSDSGYLKTFFSIGVFPGLVLYGLIIVMVVSFSSAIPKPILFTLLLLSMLLIAEIKEPFMYQNFVARVLALMYGAFLYDRFLKRRYIAPSRAYLSTA